MIAENDTNPSAEAVPRASWMRPALEYHPLDYDPKPLVLTPEQRAALDALWPREGRAGDPLCPCCGEPISPEGLAMLAT